MNKKIKFNDFLLSLEKHIIETFEELRNDIDDHELINNCRLKFTNKNVSNDIIIDNLNSLNVTREAQLFLLDNIKNINISNDKSITLEKIAKVINKIKEIVDEFGGLEKGDIFFDKVFNKGNIFLKNELIIQKIKNQTKCEENYKADSFNIIIDLEENKAFEQYVHATSNMNTKEGQGKLLFHVNNQKNQHIYIIEKIIKDKHNGSLIAQNNNQYRKLNLLPFVSMISKIVPLLSNLTAHENLLYFFRTPLIIMGDYDNVYKNYNTEIASFFSKNSIDERQWFFSDYFEKEEEYNIHSNIIFFLKNYTVEMVNLIKLDCLNDYVQKNEKNILQQLYNTIKSVIFFDRTNDEEDKLYIKKISVFLEKVEYYDSNYEDLQLKSFNVIKEIPINKIDEIKDIINQCKAKTILEFLKLRDENRYAFDHSLYDFIYEMKNYILDKNSKLDELLIESEYKNIYDIIKTENFRKLLNNDFINNLEIKWNDLANVFLFGFPNLLRNNHINFENEENKVYFHFLLLLFIRRTEKKAFFKIFYTHLKINGGGGFENLLNLRDESWPLFFLFEYFYPLNNLKWDVKIDLEIKRIIHRYAFFHATENIYNSFMEKNEINSIEDLQHSINMLETKVDDNAFFSNILNIKNKYNISPRIYSSLLKDNLSEYILLSFADYLEKTNKDNYLRQSILWILSNKSFDYDYWFMKK